MADSDLVLKIQADIKNAQRNLKQLKGEMGGFSKSTGQANKNTQGLMGSLGGMKGAAVAGGIAAAGAAIAGMAKRGLDAAAALQQQEVAFGTLLGSMEKGKRLMQEVQQFAAATPFQLPELNDSTKKLLAFGVAEDQVIDKLQAIGDISAGVGAPVNEIAEIFGKARVQGTLFAEDINQLVGRGIPVIQEFAKQMGVSEGEVKKLASQGKVTFSMLDKAFTDLTTNGGQFMGMMDAQSKTLNGVMSTLTDNFDMLLAGIMKPMLPAITDLMQNLVEVMSDPDIQEFVTLIGETLANGLRWIALRTKVVIKGFMEFVGAIKSTVTWVKNLVSAQEEEKKATDETTDAIREQAAARREAEMQRKKELQDRIRSTNPTINEIKGEISALKKLRDGMARTTEKRREYQREIDKLTAKLEKMNAAFAPAEKAQKKQIETNKEIERTLPIRPIQEFGHSVLAINSAGELVNETGQKLNVTFEKMDVWGEMFGENGGAAVKNSLYAIGDAMTAAFTGGEEQFKNSLKVILTTMLDFLQAELLASSAAMAIRALFTSGVSLTTDLALAAAAYGAIEVAKGAINSFQTGIDYVTHDQLAMVHKGERIQTAGETEAQRRGTRRRNVNAIHVSRFKTSIEDYHITQGAKVR